MPTTTTPRPIAARPLTGVEAVTETTGAREVEVPPPVVVRQAAVRIRATNNTAGGAGED